MSKNTNIFRSIVKGTMILGGSQMFTALINVVRGKLVAIILGAYGMGLNSLLQSCMAPFQQLFSFGLPTPAVRSISLEQGEDRLHTIVAFRRVLMVMAFFGTAVMILLSTWLCQLTLGNKLYIDWFIGLAFALLFTILCMGECAILQGLRKLKHYAVATVSAPLIGLVVGVPLYYFYGVQGIVPTLCIIAFLSWLVTRIAASRVLPPLPHQSWDYTLKIGCEMMALGGTMMLAGFIGAGCNYLINTYISGICMEDIGFYQAATSITLQCTSMIFGAMAADYFPHLSSIVQDSKEAKSLVQQEGEVVLLVITPIILLLVLFAPLIVEVLLTKEFLCIVPMLRMLAISFLGRAYCFPQDYICIARGDKLWFFFVEGIFSNVKTIILFILGYAMFGLMGLGYAALANAAVDIVSSTVFNRIRYGICYEWKYLRLFGFCLLLCVAALAVSLYDSTLATYSILSAITIAGCFFSLRCLDQRIEVREIIRAKLRKRTVSRCAK